MMEEAREERVAKVLSWLQSTARGHLSRKQYSKLKQQKMALYCVQRSIRNFMVGKHWLWWQLWLAIKPSLRSAKFAEIKAQLEAKRSEADAKMTSEKNARKAVETINTQSDSEKAELENTLSGGSNVVQ